jgi:hypothetical protein
MNIDTANLVSLSPENDLDMSFPKLDAFLLDLTSATSSTTVCDFQRLFEYPVYPADEIPNLLEHPMEIRSTGFSRSRLGSKRTSKHGRKCIGIPQTAVANFTA